MRRESPLSRFPFRSALPDELNRLNLAASHRRKSACGGGGSCGDSWVNRKHFVGRPHPSYLTGCEDTSSVQTSNMQTFDFIRRGRRGWTKSASSQVSSLNRETYGTRYWYRTRYRVPVPTTYRVPVRYQVGSRYRKKSTIVPGTGTRYRTCYHWF